MAGYWQLVSESKATGCPLPIKPYASSDKACLLLLQLITVSRGSESARLEYRENGAERGGARTGVSGNRDCYCRMTRTLNTVVISRLLSFIDCGKAFT